jgi:hypothetical protein
VLYRRGKIISVGHNQKKTHPLVFRFYDYPYLHAEASCIIKAHGVDLHNAVLACVRINCRGDVVYSRPCSGCIAMMRHYGIHTMVYSSKDGVEKEII